MINQTDANLGTTEKIRIVLADDHAMLRDGLGLWIQSIPDMELAGEAADGLQALRLTEQLDPDVVILDLSLPRLEGLEVTRRIHERFPSTRVVVLSMYCDEEHAMKAFHFGARAYVGKVCSHSVLETAIRQVMLGRQFLSPPLQIEAVNKLAQRTRQGASDIYELLTSREREILQLVVEGLTSVKIAERLFISPRTVETHRSNLMKKLNIRRHVDLVRFALNRTMGTPLPGPATAGRSENQTVTC